MSSINFQPLNDMVLVRPDQPPEKIGSIIVPEMAKTYGHQPGRSEECFTGTVVAVGPGDRHKPFELVACPTCKKRPVYSGMIDAYVCACEAVTSRANAMIWNQGRHAMQLRVGDRVVYPRRPSAPGGEFHVEIEGELLQMFHEQQFAFAVIED